MSEARIKWIAGPVLRARGEGFRMREAVQVGESHLLGEMIRIAADEITVQVYEDTTGLKTGATVYGAGQPLSIPLGPGLLGGIFDGLLRPLSDTGTPYVMPGLRSAPRKVFRFVPGVRVGQRLGRGAVFGAAQGGAREQALLLPPDAEGEVAEIVAAGEYAENAPLLTLTLPDGGTRAIAMCNNWPVRQPRPVAARLPNDEPLLTGQRIVDSIFPVARVTTLTGREGSITLIGSISPPSGDFSEPVTTHTKRYIKSFWALDVKRAQARFYPAIHPLQSYSEDVAALTGWWQGQGSARWAAWRRTFLTLLEDQTRLERMARIIGKDAMPARAQLTLLSADLVNEAFLRQSAYSATDRYCSLARQIAMMRVLARFIELVEQAHAAGVTPERIAALPVLRRIARMGEDIPETELARFADLEAALERAFTKLLEVAA